ncbi:transposase [Glycomyces luteolus]|uniref:Transposase n=1 Tax=Glycomyces luteolus TaxID=2670330 RepID=A0A9X3PE96_9ACTN|nr:transposase [Glycomyces luteolus]MDA1361890.1 transposase [Glycomyces luteolus]
MTVASSEGIKQRPLPRYEQRTGLDTEQLLLLERAVEARIGSWQPDTGRRKALDLFDAIVACLIYLRHNTIQAALGEQSQVSQATVSRYVEKLEPVVSTCLDQLALDLREQAARSDLVVDGFLIPTRDLTAPAGLFSGKRHRPGLNTQIITDLRGRVIDGGRIVVGSVHDAKAFKESGLAKSYEMHTTGNGPSLIGDLWLPQRQSCCSPGRSISAVGLWSGVLRTCARGRSSRPDTAGRCRRPTARYRR